MHKTLIFYGLCSFIACNGENFFDRVAAHMKNDELEQALHEYITINNKGVDDSLINYDIAHLYSMIGQHDKAIPYYEKALQQDPTHSTMRYSFSKTHLALGNFEKGLPLFEHRFLDPEKTHRVYNYLNLTPQDFTGKTVILLAEWGFGDYIQFIRYAKLIKDQHPKKIIVQVFPALKKLFSTCPYIDEIISDDVNPPWVDLYIPYLSLPLIFKTRLETIPAPIPYLYADSTLCAYWKEKISHDHGFKIGLCWQAKQIYLEDHMHSRRSLPLSLFTQLLDNEHMSFYSLQKGNGCGQLKDVPEGFIHDFGNELDQEHGAFMDTAALISNLDLVISADTSIVHVAGALGAKVWVLLPYVAEWRWLTTRTDSPWYPNNVRLFRQPKPGDWQTVIDQVKQALLAIIPR